MLNRQYLRGGGTLLSRALEIVYDGLDGVVLPIVAVGGSIVVPADKGNIFRLALGATGILKNPQGTNDGATYLIIIHQAGSFNLSYGSRYKWLGGVVPTISTGAGAIDLLTMVVDGDDLLCSMSQAFA